MKAIEMVETNEAPDHHVLEEFAARLSHQGQVTASGHGESGEKDRVIGTSGDPVIGSHEESFVVIP